MGFLIVTRKLFIILCFWYKLLIRQGKNLAQRYGKGSWVVITGSSDGIGKQFAIILAKQGFNIVLVARNQNKLQQVETEIKKLSPKTETKIIVADFTQSFKDGFFDNIYNQLQDLDISLLINNVGVDIFQKFEEADEELIMTNIKVNVVPVTMLTRKLINKLRQRNQNGKQKSGILNVASFAGQIPHAYFNVYSATKAYNIMFSQSIASEFPDLDILILNPSEVSTNMVFNRPPDIMTITAEQCARQTLADLGNDLMTNGHWNHKLQAALYLNVPFKLYSFIYQKFVAPDWFKERKIGEQKLKKQN